MTHKTKSNDNSVYIINIDHVRLTLGTCVVMKVELIYSSIIVCTIQFGGGGSLAFCRSLHQIGQSGSGKMRHNVAKCFITLKIA